MSCEPYIEPYGSDYVKLHLVPGERPVVLPIDDLDELYEAIHQFDKGGELNSHGWNGMIVQDMDIIGKFGCSAPCLFDDAERRHKKTGRTVEVWQCIKVYGKEKELIASDEEPDDEAGEVEEDCCCCQYDPKQTGLEAFL